MDCKINWTKLNSSTVEELLLMRICPALITQSVGHSNTYWKSLLGTSIYSFDVFDGNLNSRGEFPFRWHQKKAEK